VIAEQEASIPEIEERVQKASDEVDAANDRVIDGERLLAKHDDANVGDNARLDEVKALMKDKTDEMKRVKVRAAQASSTVRPGSGAARRSNSAR
jgi:predicted  nucleic acid-binding Zn-ribbon protein